MLKAINDFSQRVHDAVPVPVAAILEKGSMDNLGRAFTVVKVAKYGYKWFDILLSLKEEDSYDVTQVL